MSDTPQSSTAAANTAANAPATGPAPAGASATPAVPAVTANPAGGRRRTALAAVAAAVLLVGGGWGAWYALVGRHHEATDNAYVQGNLVQITPLVSGSVVAIQADDNDRVRAGMPLLKLDPADARLALSQAEAQLAQTVRQVRSLYANNGSLDAQVSLREAEAARADNQTASARADVARAQAEVARLQDDLARRQPLLASGAVGREEVAHVQAQLGTAREALQAAQSAAQAAQAGASAARQAINAAREQQGAGRTQTDGLQLADHPAVAKAAADVRQAWLALKRTELPAPIDGIVAKRAVQIGQRVQPGTPVMSVVALDQLWVDANFKESQLRSLRIGQPATLVADVYGKSVRYSGHIIGLGAGTGSAFALLPAQNATGNWIKVVQRVPVRIALDPVQLREHPLRLGLSMTVDVDVSDASGALLAEAPRSQPVASTTVFDPLLAEADGEVARVIAANAGRGATLARAAAPAGGLSGQARAEPDTGAVAGRHASGPGSHASVPGSHASVAGSHARVAPQAVAVALPGR
ncbi:HlyD family efflux transporter periplasmic adaptor subunit [Pseudaquabacterium rugosum]|uniref:HlyD family efflux transporter periplasmic adaptor subunit n=1 Tax=Pseudaquabacterium rugosum TaxID=2984194 RepID=A0ABU9B7Y5_9BURK